MSPRELVEAFYFEVWNRADEDRAREILHDSFRFRGSLGAERIGPDGFIAYLRDVHRALGDYRCIIDDLVVEEDRAAARMRFTGRHRDVFQGVPATGRQITWGRHDQRVPERLQQQALRRGAHRHPHGEFLPFGELQRQKQGADVDDRHEHHESARRQQQKNDGTHVAKQVVVEGLGRRGHAAQRHGKHREVALEVVREFGRGLVDRRARR